MKRDLKLDSLKGFLTLLVVYGHIPFDLFIIEKTVVLKYISAFIFFFICHCF